MNPKYQRSRKVSLKERLCQVTCGWYSMSMATGGIAVRFKIHPTSSPASKRWERCSVQGQIQGLCMYSSQYRRF
ncbi:hypothetical protein BDV37DRAFT_237484 [Aspergillus pseudonomiae]|uniref:Uncharacterized protein n=1 Tax=Aspergillus pseudonomiae TaxID=1506151 RepID=A0A5N7DQY3_9EURO|nr:uncharacterized protein BDV37DRAFT_237484 [Aspergillus pseudonomiae]KAE8408877.1 hypothetical protein BDV37DRAFT_237484 [Aspergillus pseudonomiae]